MKQRPDQVHLNRRRRVGALIAACGLGITAAQVQAVDSCSWSQTTTTQSLRFLNGNADYCIVEWALEPTTDCEYDCHHPPGEWPPCEPQNCNPGSDSFGGAVLPPEPYVRVGAFHPECPNCSGESCGNVALAARAGLDLNLGGYDFYMQDFQSTRTCWYCPGDYYRRSICQGFANSIFGADHVFFSSIPVIDVDFDTQTIGHSGGSGCPDAAWAPFADESVHAAVDEMDPASLAISVNEQFMVIRERYPHGEVVHVYRGVEVYGSAGPIRAMGAFALPQFTINEHGRVVGGLDDMIQASPGLLSLRVEAGSRSFVLGQFDGDLVESADGAIDALDLAYVRDRAGLTVNDADYDSRCDLDADGDIDEDDVSFYTSLVKAR